VDKSGGTATTEVMDINGRLVKTININLVEGRNNIVLSDLNSLTTGIYFARINGTDTKVLKLIKN
jgi:hypothetical protein